MYLGSSDDSIIHQLEKKFPIGREPNKLPSNHDDNENAVSVAVKDNESGEVQYAYKAKALYSCIYLL